MKPLRFAATSLLVLAAVVVLVADLTMASAPAQDTAAAPAPQFGGIETWINSPPLALDRLRGQVVLVDFWTYSCVNCLNHLPYVRKWSETYRDQDLAVVGIHTPEFAFEKSTRNVEEAVARLQIRYPVALDNDYATWKSFGNHFWPAVYLIDRQGHVVYSHFGEGRYQATEDKIRALLAEPAAVEN